MTQAWLVARSIVYMVVKIVQMRMFAYACCALKVW